MSKVSEINILCVGELTAETSSFLSFYSQSPSEQGNRIYAYREGVREESVRFEQDRNGQLLVFLHEVEELQDMEVYLKYPFDAILFFVQIDHFHNTAKNILDTLQLFSQINGTNVYKVPFRVVALSQRSQRYYDDIGRGDKHRLIDELDGILTQDQIIYVQFSCSYKQSLTRFYREIIDDSAAGIKQSTYTGWYFRGIQGYYSCGQLILSLFKLYGEMKFLFLRWRRRGSWKG